MEAMDEINRGNLKALCKVLSVFLFFGNWFELWDR